MSKVKYVVTMILSASMILSSCASLDLPIAKPKNSDASLLASIRIGNVDGVQKAVHDGANINKLSGNLHEVSDWGGFEKNPFRIACYLYSLNTARWLIQNGANANCKDAEGNPLIFYTARIYDKKLCQLLLDHGAKINATGKDGYTALDNVFFGATTSNAEDDLTISQLQTFLIGNGAKITPRTFGSALKGYNNDGYCKYNLIQDNLKLLLASGQKSGLSRAYEAAILGNSSEVLSLLSTGQISNNEKNRVLFYTVAFGSPNTVEQFLQAGFNIHVSDGDGNTLLAIAAKSGNADTLQYLISKQLSLETQNHDQYTPLELAVVNDKINTTQILLSAGAKVTPKLTFRSSDVLWSASGNGDLNMVKLLLDSGYPKEDINLAMQAAAMKDQPSILQYFLSLGINQDVKFQGDTALGIACQFGNFESVKFLVEHGADVNGEANGMTPLENANAGGYTDIVNYLISKGAVSDR
ncbi:MAG: ankyrin repeat domain-containing protein [Ethanoligenens sp.]|uniref:ankyrin repeat domain-containing protein n=1 Tax=Ethanoligenens sp. TaxID=2099655 RepID=UPI0039E87047